MTLLWNLLRHKDIPESKPAVSDEDRVELAVTQSRIRIKWSKFDSLINDYRRMDRALAERMR